MKLDSVQMEHSDENDKSGKQNSQTIPTRYFVQLSVMLF